MGRTGAPCPRSRHFEPLATSSRATRSSALLDAASKRCGARRSSKEVTSSSRLGSCEARFAMPLERPIARTRGELPESIRHAQPFVPRRTRLRATFLRSIGATSNQVAASMVCAPRRWQFQRRWREPELQRWWIDGISGRLTLLMCDFMTLLSQFPAAQREETCCWSGHLAWLTPGDERELWRS